jgi:hypothetical protein
VFFRWLHFRQPRRQQPHVAAHSSDHRIGSGLRLRDRRPFGGARHPLRPHFARSSSAPFRVGANSGSPGSRPAGPCWLACSAGRLCSTSTGHDYAGSEQGGDRIRADRLFAAGARVVRRPVGVPEPQFCAVSRPARTLIAAEAGVMGADPQRIAARTCWSHDRGRSLIPAASRSTTSAMRAARRSGRRVVASIHRR